MLTLEDAIPCSICGCKPILSHGIISRVNRLKCPNYKRKEIKHGNLSSDRNGLTVGFTNWNHLFWNEKQAETEGIPAIVKEWNYIHENGVTNKEFEQLKF